MRRRLIIPIVLSIIPLAVSIPLGIVTMTNTVFAQTRGECVRQDNALRAFRLSHPAVYASSPYWSREFVLEYDKLHWSLTDKGYWQTDDFHGDYYNITNGIRRTVGQPE